MFSSANAPPTDGNTSQTIPEGHDMAAGPADDMEYQKDIGTMPSDVGQAQSIGVGLSDVGQAQSIAAGPSVGPSTVNRQNVHVVEAAKPPATSSKGSTAILQYDEAQRNDQVHVRLETPEDMGMSSAAESSSHRCCAPDAAVPDIDMLAESGDRNPGANESPATAYDMEVESSL
ncbi:hypothetical protein DL89DRAFT_312386 [Linderina pennispora]|uniref:Uncharacterized protein n=1 Tax=Linderina pennispora TaxID=61395 RepID=A0A1Y1WGP2_9FUNG|nr:uncharacterized protein DL89DRAFT_312386 [Linderina pennispora]ORX72406.1 hypothetical protein DL89DRAFT_312386 [Linderina pennispora]